jgi:hypothetical protein
MSYGEDNLTPMINPTNNRSLLVQHEDRQESPQAPFEPWYRSLEPWLLIAVVLVMAVVAWPSLTRGPSSFDFWLWGLMVLLVVAFAAVQFRAWRRRGPRRRSGRT